MPAESPIIGLIAGSGQLPLQIAEKSPFMPVVCLNGFADRADYGERAISLRPGQVGRILQYFKAQGCTHLILAGGMQKPSFLSVAPDWGGVCALAHIGLSYFKGDDSLLRAVRAFVERNGFQVLGADTVLPDLTLPPEAVTIPDSAKQALEAHARADKGQALLLHTDESVSLEGRSGTEALIKTEGREGDILIKMMKPQQDPDLDRPVIGPDTVKAMAEIGGQGILVQADTVFILDRETVFDLAKAHRLFVKGAEL